MTGEPADLVDVFGEPPAKLFWSDERREQIRQGLVKARLRDAIVDVLFENRDNGAAIAIAELLKRAKNIDAEIPLDSIPREKEAIR